MTYQEWGSASWLVKLSRRLPRAVALTVLYQPPPEWSRVFPSFINLARKRKSQTLRNFFSWTRVIRVKEPPRFLYDSLENIFNRERERGKKKGRETTIRWINRQEQGRREEEKEERKRKVTSFFSSLTR